ncbi:hypothetical protein KIMC2_14520 [Xylocopilactobacillus apis]|uniref:Uncharacterized protein n=1 Tax=Xylocopilactobacillus apis TaxID=2932183 RepID=A0AAU9D647_9LACO|nr:hypothetical protein KIMC2_14520 [Xylocopilactobacillus apis]
MILTVNSVGCSTKQQLGVGVIQLDDHGRILKLGLNSNLRHATYFSKEEIGKYEKALTDFGFFVKPKESEL